MKEVQITKYQCKKCKKEYKEKDEAISCEKKEITEDRGVKIGDIVKVTGGEGSGGCGKVTRVNVINKYWGHHEWARYWHTIAIEVDLINDIGSRFLTFDNYETIK